MKSLLFSLLLLTSGSIILTPSSLLAKESSTKKVVLLHINDATASDDITHEVELGESLEIQLNNNGSIGESWHFSSFSQEEVLSLNSSFDGTRITLKDNNHRIGAPEPYVWSFTPDSVGATSVYFYKINRNGDHSDLLKFDITVVPAKPTTAKIELSSRAS